MLQGFRQGLTRSRCTAKEFGPRLEISDLEIKGIALPIYVADQLCSYHKGADQLHSNLAADLHGYFHSIDSTIPLLPKSEI